MIYERRNRIVELVNQKGTVNFAELMQMFPEVSEMTLRKDLKYLDGQQKLVRIHGGARSLSTIKGIDIPLQERLGQNIEKKRQIAQKASALIQKNDTIFLDSGSTMTELAKAFPDESCLVFTAGISCAMALSQKNNVNVYMLGGRLNKPSLSVRDSRVIQELGNVYFDTAFISVNGYAQENGFSCRSAERWEMEKILLSRAGKIVVLMDSGKVGQICPFSICQPHQIDMLISDDEMDPDTHAALEGAGVEVL